MTRSIAPHNYAKLGKIAVTRVTCRVSPVTCHISLMPTARAMVPPPANSHAQQNDAADLDLDPSQISCKDPKIIFFCATIFNHFSFQFVNSETKTNVLSLLFPKKSSCN